jgi:hypothetical protein
MMLGALIDLGVPLDVLNDSIQSVVKTVTVSSVNRNNPNQQSLLCSGCQATANIRIVQQDIEIE